MADPSSDPTEALEACRRTIDEADRQIVELLNRRAAAAVEIGKLKDASGSPMYVPDRERRVMNKVHELNRGPLPRAAIEAVYREIISASIAMERPLKVGFLGPEGSFSHLAARAHFGASVEYRGVDDIQHVFEDVDRGVIDVGLVPIENSTGGGVHDTLDCFMQSSAGVCAEVLISIHHHLMSHADVERVQRVCSRPEVFEQCRKWLAAHLPQAERVPVASSAKAAELASADHALAAVGSGLAAELHALPIRAQNIEDNPQNVTRFFVVSRITARPTGHDKTAIMFTTAHKPGALAEVVNVFARHGVNLTHIDKRPSQRINWEYYFFIDCEGHHEEPAMQDALAEARDHCLHLSVLGSFPKATDVLG